MAEDVHAAGDFAPLVGRETDRGAARSLIARGVGLITLWGPPGIGKSRLARELAREVATSDFVALEGARGLQGLEAAVLPRLERATEGLVVLDNLEHLLDDETDGPEVLNRIQAWVDGGPEARSLLVTSRRRLRLPAEHALPLQPLSEAHGLELFTHLVRRHWPGFEPEHEDRAALLGLLGALEGLPLALELAAARWGLMGTQGLLERLAEPLRVLARSPSTDSRHATLREAIAWSWELLTAENQAALQAVSLFEGRFTVPDAEAMIGGDALGCLESLRDSALVQLPEPGWFELLASIKAFAREQTGPERRHALAGAHADWLVQRLNEGPSAEAILALSHDIPAVARVLLDRGDPRVEGVLEQLADLLPTFHAQLYDEAVRRLGTPRVRMLRALMLARHQRGEEALQEVDAALGLGPEPRIHASLLLVRALVAFTGGDAAGCLEASEQALVIARAHGMRHVVGSCLSNLATIDVAEGRFESAEALAIMREVDAHRSESTVLLNQARLWQAQGMLDEAERALRTALELKLDDGDAHTYGWLETNLGGVLQEAGRLEEARDCYLSAWETLRRESSPRAKGRCLGALASVEAMLGHLDEARTRLAEAQQVVATADQATRDIVGLYGLFLLQAEGHDEAVWRRLGESGHLKTLGSAREAARLLRRNLQKSGPALVVGEDGFWLPDGEQVALGRHKSLWGMFLALAEARRTGDGVLGIDELFEAGWPGVRISPDSARNRVHVNLVKLRAMGLRDLLLRSRGGYLLDRSIPIRWESRPG